jgi:hypothetical protein
MIFFIHKIDVPFEIFLVFFNNFICVIALHKNMQEINSNFNSKMDCPNT